MRVGSIFWLALGDGEPPCTAEAIDGDQAATYRRIFHSLLDQGITMAPSMYEVGFLSLAHRPHHLDRLADALGKALEAAAAGGDSEPAR